MANRIKGITVEIGGDTTKLSKALDGVNKNIRSTQTQLKDVEKLLKLDPTNTELLAQKQKLLSDSVSATKEKLKTLKTAAEQANAVLANGDISQEQYDALQREIIETEQALQRLQSEAENSRKSLEKIGEAGAVLEAAGDKISGFGQKLTTSVTLPLAAVGTVGAKSFADVDKIMQLTNKTMGNTAEQAAALDEAMKEAAANSTYGMEDTATAALNFARAGLTAEQAADALAPAMNLAAGEGGNLDTVSAGLVATINGFHDAFSDAGLYADIFASACNNSALDVDSLSNAMSVAAPIFASAGYEVRDAALYMGVMANNGIEADKAANSLKTGIARLVSPAKEGAIWLDELGVSITDTDGSMKDSVTIQKQLHDAFAKLSESEQIAAASAIFGKNQMSPWLALINTAPEDVNALNTTLLTCSGTTEEMSSAMMGGFGGSLEKLKSSIDVLVYTLGQALAPVIQRVVDHLQSLADKLNALTPEQQQTIVKFGMLAAAIGPVLVVLGNVTSGVGKFMQIAANMPATLSKMKAGFSAVQAAIAGVSSTVLIIVGVIAVLVAAFKHLWDTNEAFRNSMTNIWDGIVAKFQTFFQTITDKINELGFDFASFSDLLKGIWDGLCNYLAPVFETTFQFLSDTISSWMDVILGMIDVVVGIFTGDWQQVWTGVKEFFGGIWDDIVSKLKFIFSLLCNIFGTDLETVKSFWVDVWTNIKDFFINIWETISKFFTNIFTSISTFFTTAWTGIKNFFVTIWTAIYTSVSQKINLIKTVITTVWNAISKVISTVLHAIQTTISTVWNTIYNFIAPLLDAFKYLFETIFQAIQIIIGNVHDWISQKISTVWNAIVGFIKPLLNNIKSLFGTIWNGISAAVSTAMDAIQNVVKTVWKVVSAYISTTLNSIKSTVSTIWNSIKSTVSNVLNGIKSTVSNVWNTIKSTVSNVLNSIRSTVSNIWDTIKSAISGKITSIKQTITDGFNTAVNFVKNLAGDAWNWGADIINNIVSGINDCIGNVSDAVTGVADKIKEFLHFSVPDKGPLRDFESWMPDFMNGLAKGINKHKDVVEKAVSGVAEAMRLTMNSDLQYRITGMNDAMLGGRPDNGGTVNNYYNTDNSRTVNQTNNSPKALSRLEIYRQTRNAVKE